MYLWPLNPLHLKYRWDLLAIVPLSKAFQIIITLVSDRLEL